MISIIVPYRNAAPWIRRCCESLHHIADEGFEFLMVDDNHELQDTEDSKIVVEYAKIDDRFRLFYNSLTPGVSGARNCGINRAEGEWITFLDADDELTENADWAYHKTVKVDANIHQMNHFRAYSYNARATRYDNREGWYDIQHLPEAWYGVWNKVFRKSFLDENDIRFKEGLQYGEDGLFVLYCLAADNRIHMGERTTRAIIKHFDNKGSLSKVKTLEDVLEQIDEYKRFMLAQDDPKVRKAVCSEIALLWAKRIPKFFNE